jgi:hypothetical protein
MTYAFGPERQDNIPSFIAITASAIVHEVNILDELIPEAGSIYIIDRGYLDFKRLYMLHQCSSFFVVHAKVNTGLRRLYSMHVDKLSGLRCDQIVASTEFYARKNFSEKLRRIKFIYRDKEKRLILLTNQISLPAFTTTQQYRCQCRIIL